MSKIKICLDPGHGGKDPGAMNGELRESLAALQISFLIKDFLLETDKYDVIFTRIDDKTYPSLTERYNISNSIEADAFISIHLNSSDNKKASGIETLRYDKVGQKTKLLAENIQKKLIESLGWKDRGVKERTNLTVLKKTKASAVLVECGFISHEEESKLLFSEEFQTKIAKAITDGIEETFGK